MIGLTPWSRCEPCLGGRVRLAEIKRQSSSAPGKTRKLAAASRACSAAPRPLHDVTGLPACFSGNRAEWRDFLRSVDRYVELNPASYPTEEAKIALHMSLLPEESLSLARELWSTMAGEISSCTRFLQLLTRELGITTADHHLLFPASEDAVPHQSFQEVTTLLQALQVSSAPPKVLQGISAVLQEIQAGSVRFQDLQELSTLLQNLPVGPAPFLCPKESPASLQVSKENPVPLQVSEAAKSAPLCSRTLTKTLLRSRFPRKAWFHANASPSIPLYPRGSRSAQLTSKTAKGKSSRCPRAPRSDGSPTVSLRRCHLSFPRALLRSKTAKGSRPVAPGSTGDGSPTVFQEVTARPTITL
ncbi:uncharacterized protein LOC124377356 [Silurus meridionalis]|uniref:uncharacterized protein LOC124377356 n=1 Tax=Silurus meridionalis TaxID=175797 RepID=UPI001EEBC7D3|nr:uncharacterized protein LOC124377356 [Silurus meridionalis]